jgi:hypothetical protein
MVTDDRSYDLALTKIAAKDIKWAETVAEATKSRAGIAANQKVDCNLWSDWNAWKWK